MSHFIDHEPMPIPNQSRPIWDLVIEDMKERDRVGRERYGTPLQAFNGRRPLVDAYQEALDLVVYLRQVIEERENAVAEADRLRSECHMLRLENSRMRENVRGIIAEECEDLAVRLGALVAASRDLLPVLRDRLDGTRSEHLVDRLQAAVEGGVR